MARFLALSVVVLAAALAVTEACGGGSDECGERVVVALSSDGEPVPTFRAYLDLGGEGVISVAGSSGRAVFPAGPPVARATIKAGGFRTARVGWGAGAPVLGTCGELAVDLVPLPAPERAAAWWTAFDASSGMEDFLSLAVPFEDAVGPVHAVKFVMEGFRGEDPKVWFADTRKYPIHCDFVRNALRLPFASCDQYALATYHGTDRDRIAGTIHWRPDAAVTIGETAVHGVFTVEYFPYDDLTAAMAARANDLLQERMPFASLAGGERRVAYVPAGSMQEAAARAAAADLAAGGVDWLARSDLYAGVTRQYLNPAESYGRLRVMSPEDLDRTPVSYMDILVLTRLPNDLPLVGGTITEELQTPLAHVNVAARARGTPNLALVGASEDPAVAPLVGKTVHFVVKTTGFSLTEATAEEAMAFWEERLDRPPLVPEADLLRDDFPAFEELGHADAISVGSKAANLAELHHVLGQAAPDGFAVPFHHQHEFARAAVVTAAACSEATVECRASGASEAACEAARSLCLGPGGAAGETIAGLLDRLLSDPSFTTNSEVRAASLGVVRSLHCIVPMDPTFAEDLDARVSGLFGTRTVRLRSSSNAEDLPEFTGAGLYTSLSATAGGGEKAPSRRICRVWGSLWNWQAFEERSFWKVDHRAVVMGVAVHPSFPDEAANGVLITQNIVNPGVPGMYVNVQLGEVSVTNPDNGAVPEEFTIIPAPDGTVQASRTRLSSLSPDIPILSDAEVLALYLAAAKVHDHYAREVYGKSPASFALDIEFKFHGPGRELFLKQVRPYRMP